MKEKIISTNLEMEWRNATKSREKTVHVLKQAIARDHTTWSSIWNLFARVSFSESIKIA